MYTDFGTQARVAMLKKHITMSALAKEIGVSCSYISEILKGTRNGKAQKAKIAEVLGIEVENITNGA